MGHYHAEWDPNQGKISRIRLVKEILKANKGRMKATELRKELNKRGYPHLYQVLEAMGFTIGEDGYIYGD